MALARARRAACERTRFLLRCAMAGPVRQCRARQRSNVATARQCRAGTRGAVACGSSAAGAVRAMSATQRGAVCATPMPSWSFSSLRVRGYGRE